MPPLRTARTVRQNGLAIRAFREKDGWNLTEFATHLGVVKSEISKIETEAKPRVNLIMINKIARALSVPVGAILRDSPTQVDLRGDELVEVRTGLAS